MGQYIMKFSSFYVDPTTRKIADNPNTAAHRKDYSNKVFTTSEEPLNIRNSLRHIDGTISFVFNKETGNEVCINPETQEIEEFNIDDLDEFNC